MPSIATRRLAGQDVSKKVAQEVLCAADYHCAYCDSTWASVVDHVRPVTRGGTKDIGNLVAACDRCNRQKSDMTPAEWKAWRIERDMPWPPPNGFLIFVEFARTLSEKDQWRLVNAYRAGDERIKSADKAMLDRHFKGSPRTFDEDRAELLELIAEFEAERTF